MTLLLSLVVSTAALLISQLEPNSQSLFGKGAEPGVGPAWLIPGRKASPRTGVIWHPRTEPSHPRRWTLLRRDAGTWRNSHPHPSPEPCDQVRETDGRTDRQMQDD